MVQVFPRWFWEEPCDTFLRLVLHNHATNHHPCATFRDKETFVQCQGGLLHNSSSKAMAAEGFGMHFLKCHFQRIFGWLCLMMLNCSFKTLWSWWIWWMNFENVWILIIWASVGFFQFLLLAFRAATTQCGKEPFLVQKFKEIFRTKIGHLPQFVTTEHHLLNPHWFLSPKLQFWGHP